MDTTTRMWLALCKRAGKLKTDQFLAWAFAVGTQGTLEERIALGKAALRALFGIDWNFTISPNIEGGRDE